MSRGLPTGAGVGRPRLAQTLHRHLRRPVLASVWAASALLSAPGAGAAEPVMNVMIQRFEITGASAVPEAELQAALAPWLHTTASRDELARAARTLERLYQTAHRQVARVTLPPQDITDGVVRLRVAEARFGSVRVQGDAVQAISVDQAAAFVQAAQAQHEHTLLRIDAVENATGRLNEWPGLIARSSLVAGSRPGETDVVLALQDRRPWDAQLRLDNEGARATGTARVGLDTSFVVPGGLGQSLSASAQISEGSRLLRLSASAALNERGLRASFYGSALDYRLITPEFNALAVKGPSDTLGASLSWAVERSADGSSDASAQFERRQFDNQALGTTLSKYHIDALSLRWAQQWAKPMERTRIGHDLSATVGQVDLNGSPNQASDALTVRTEGGYAVLRGSVQGSQAVSVTQSWALRLNGQVASKNLDVSERLPMAGPSGVRAYPVGEATGSRALLASLEGLQNLGAWGRSDTTLAAFADLGVADSLVRTSFAGAPAKNRLRLAGAGLWLEWRPAGSAVVARLSAARPIGSHPNPTASNTNQDGTHIGTRWWASAQWGM